MRRKPYTVRGIRRAPCARCGAPSVYQWQACADGRQYRAVCAACDVMLNVMVMRFFFGRTREADIAKYRRKIKAASSNR